MLRPRIIPCLLIHDGGLVKTIQFKNPKYVGDPLNAVRIFNEKEVDELIVLDIDASHEGHSSNETMIAQLAAECRMPLCYGGGIKSIDQIKKLISLGVEKIAIGSAAIENQELIINAVKHFGSQSVVGVIDVKMTGLTRSPEVVIRNASKKTGMNPLTFALQLQELGVGEILLNSVDRDGKMNGYDLNLISSIYGTVNIPLTVLGGAGLLKDIKELVKLFPVIGAAAGSLFVFKGKYRAVLINYPTIGERIEYVYSATK
jgi:imidazole glycerol-phosphate synthase subunit HisF